jgi:hypothetical protein
VFQPSRPSLNLTNGMRRNIELSRVFRMNCWAKFVGLLLIAVVLLIVVMPDDVDLPPTAQFSCGRQSRQKGPPISGDAIISASITLLRPNSLSSPLRVGLPVSADFSTNLIDLNCTRLC